MSSCLTPDDSRGISGACPATLSAAWFVRHIEVIEVASELVRPELHQPFTGGAWIGFPDQLNQAVFAQHGVCAPLSSEEKRKGWVSLMGPGSARRAHSVAGVCDRHHGRPGTSA